MPNPDSDTVKILLYRFLLQKHFVGLMQRLLLLFKYAAEVKWKYKQIALNLPFKYKRNE